MKNRFCLRLLALVLLALGLASCGGGQTEQVQPTSTNAAPGLTSSTDPASPSPSTDTQPPAPAPTNPEDEILPEGSLLLAGANNGLYPTDATLQFVLTVSTFGRDVGPPKLTINGTPVDQAFIKVTPNSILAFVKLAEGRNDLVLDAYDTYGRTLYMEKTIWAGSHKLLVDIVDDNGARFTGDVKLKLQLTDDREVGVALSSTGGHAEFNDIPSTPVIVEAQSSDNRMGAVGAMGSDGHITLQLLKFNEPTPIDNNDFSQGLAGWDYGSSQVTLVPHVEDVGPAYSEQNDVDAIKAPGVRVARSATITRADQNTGVTSGTNMDAVLSTAGGGRRTLSRTFTIKPGTSSVSVRYRFVIAGSSDGDADAGYNYFYSVRVRSRSGDFVVDSNTDNGLGHDAFDDSGSTAWKTIRLQTDKEGETVQIDMVVERAPGCAQDGQLVVDLIQEKDEVTPSLTWDKNAGGLQVGYKVGKKALGNPVSIAVFWANGPTYNNRIGSAITSVVVPAGTSAGTVGSQNVPGALMQEDPQGTTHLIAVVSEDAVGPVRDVKIGYGPQARPEVVSAEMIDLVRDGLRSAGTAAATISSTARTPADQARVMLDNLLKGSGPLSSNITSQWTTYAPSGRAVIRLFGDQTQGMTLEQAKAHYATLSSAMLEMINAQLPTDDYPHVADPSKICVVDLPLAYFTLSGQTRFKAVASPRSSKLLKENAVFHIEILKH